MSGGYAARLTKGVDYGKCGLPEHHDNERVQTIRIAKLVKLIQNCKYLVAHTGAGISTASGIPDFRGPQGIWTKELKGDKMPQVDLPWENAKPTLCHRALVELHRMGKLKFIISQNVDCLHLRSGIPHDVIAELHGNVFLEKCPTCKTKYYRHFDIQGIGFKPTGRFCEMDGCTSELKDELLDWDDALPYEALKQSEYHSEKADLAICLGTSLRVQPASELPLKTTNNGGKLSIINLQKTEKDEFAHVRIFGTCDDVMAQVMTLLNIEIPKYNPLIDFIVTKESLIVKHEVDQIFLPKNSKRKKFPHKYKTSLYFVDQDGLKEETKKVEKESVGKVKKEDDQIIKKENKKAKIQNNDDFYLHGDNSFNEEDYKGKDFEIADEEPFLGKRKYKAYDEFEDDEDDDDEDGLIVPRKQKPQAKIKPKPKPKPKQRPKQQQQQKAVSAHTKKRKSSQFQLSDDEYDEYDEPREKPFILLQKPDEYEEINTLAQNAQITKNIKNSRRNLLYNNNNNYNNINNYTHDNTNNTSYDYNTTNPNYSANYNNYNNPNYANYNNYNNANYNNANYNNYDNTSNYNNPNNYNPNVNLNYTNNPNLSSNNNNYNANNNNNYYTSDPYFVNQTPVPSITHNQPSSNLKPQKSVNKTDEKYQADFEEFQAW